MTVKKPRAVIFDWDDTIIDTWCHAFPALNAALEAMGHKPWTAEEALERLVGYSARDLFSEMFADKWPEADKVYYDAYIQNATSGEMISFEHIEDIIKRLSDEGVYLSVVSNKRGELLREEVKKLGLDEYFKKVVGAGDAAADKPNPAPVYMALEESGIEPDADVWFVGDSPSDMLCAINSGCSPILLETRLPPEDVLAKSPPAKRFKKHRDFMEFVSDYFR